MNAGILTLISVALNALTAIIAPLLARKLASQTDRIRKAEGALDLVGAGLRVVDRAVEQNKDALARTGAGNRIAETIRAYGPAARQLVDSARAAATALREQARAARRLDADLVGPSAPAAQSTSNDTPEEKTL